MIRLFAGLAVVTLLAGACGGGGDQPEGVSTDGGADDVSLSIATGGASGNFYGYGGALASIWQDNLDYVRATVEETAASVENIRLLAGGDAEVATVTADVGIAAQAGEEPFDAPQEISALAAMYPNIYHIVARADAGVESFGDLRGKNVGIGDAGSGTELGFWMISDALGIERDEYGSTANLSYADASSAMGNGQLDAAIFAATAQGPTAGILELDATTDIAFVNYSEAELEAVASTTPLTADTPTFEAYEELSDQPTSDQPGLWAFLVVRDDMDEELAYDLTKTMFEQHDALAAANAPAADTLPENMAQFEDMSVHPGAARYYEEVGVDLPGGATQ